ncbi:hypothetical protein Tco_1567105, partial [Tanacetum coccineum]
FKPFVSSVVAYYVASLAESVAYYVASVVESFEGFEDGCYHQLLKNHQKKFRIVNLALIPSDVGQRKIDSFTANTNEQVNGKGQET